jgi:hypothetical protein
MFPFVQLIVVVHVNIPQYNNLLFFVGHIESLVDQQTKYITNNRI